MAIRVAILKSFYRDSVTLMRVAAEMQASTGVVEVAALMGTAANHALLDDAGLSTDESRTAGPNDLIVAVEADSARSAEEALATARRRLTEERHTLERASPRLPRNLDAALQDLPDANLALISVPGAFARLEAMRALRRGLDVFLFSDNVPIEDEVALKRYAIERDLLCMGPDCGTAYIGGIGLGFANVVPRGRVGCVSASGTGLQAVASRLAHKGEGISLGIGVGGRDLQREVGGLMTWEGIRVLAEDASTEAIVAISKPADAATHDRLHRSLAASGKPAVVCSLGAPSREADDVIWVETLEDAADAVVARLRGTSWGPRPFTDPDSVRRALAAIEARERARGDALLGLFAGGTLAYQAGLIIGSLVAALGPSASGTPEWRILDLGADEYTVGRPHPMFDPAQQGGRIRAAGHSAAIGILLLDVVLGHGAHPDPAAALAGAIEECRATAAAQGRDVVVIASVIGTAQDPQDLAEQVARLEAAGTAVFTSSAEAARFAAAILVPGLGRALLGAT